MKRIVLVISIVMLLVGLVGCGPLPRVNVSDEVSFKLVQLGDLKNDQTLLPDNNTAINLLSKAGGHFYFTDGEDLILFIGLGERNTAGYDIKVKSIQTPNDGATYNVIIEEIKPGTGDLVAQVISYPYVLVNLGHVGAKEITVQDINGNKLNNLSYYVNPPSVQVLGP